MKRKLFILSAVLVLALALTACGAKGFLTAEDTGDDGIVKIVCEKAGDGTAVNGYVTIGEGDCLVLSPMLDKGSIQVKAILMEREATTEDLGTASGEADSCFDQVRHQFRRSFIDSIFYRIHHYLDRT